MTGMPIVRKITSMKNLFPSERRRLKRLREILRKERRIPLETSFQERKYLLRLEAGRNRYQRRRQRMKMEMEMWERMGERPTSSIEEILDLLRDPSPTSIVDMSEAEGGTQGEEVKGDEEGTHANG